MTRKLERSLIIIGASWEILSGIITILLYSSYIKQQGIGEKDSSIVKNEAIHAIFDSLYVFSVTFGMLFVALGIINLLLMKRLKDDQISVKIPFWYLIIGLASYFLMDFLGALMFLSAGILALAKNKPISKREQEALKA